MTYWCWAVCPFPRSENFSCGDQLFFEVFLSICWVHSQSYRFYFIFSNPILVYDFLIIFIRGVVDTPWLVRDATLYVKMPRYKKNGNKSESVILTLEQYKIHPILDRLQACLAHEWDNCLTLQWDVCIELLTSSVEIYDCVSDKTRVLVSGKTDKICVLCKNPVLL